MADLLTSGFAYRRAKLLKIFRILFFLALSLIAGVLSINLFVYSETKEFIFPVLNINDLGISTVNGVSTVLGTSTEPVVLSEIGSKIPNVEVAILLGASVFKNGELTPILADRADTAVDLYKSGHVKKILATGDNSTKYYNEVTPTRDYLLKHGIPAKDILTDNSGLDTFQSMYRAKSVFGVSSALVVSQRFHLSRAVYIARGLGIDAYGIAADHRSYSIKNDFRELFATVKSVWEVGIQ